MTTVTVDRIMDYESGNLSFKEALELFRDLLNSRMINHLQGSYQRTAADLLRNGYIVGGLGKPFEVSDCYPAEC